MYGRTSREKGFTMLELVVSIGLLGIIIASSGLIFKISIETHRTVLANAEIMQKFRAISLQLDSDFQDIQRDAPLIIWFQHDLNGRYDKIMFFASGDFQSTQLYTKTGSDNVPVDYELEPEDIYQGSKYVRGNIARIYYGLANLRRDRDIETPLELREERIRERILSRRTHILTSDPSFEQWPDLEALGEVKGSFESFDIRDGLGLAYNELYEHDSLSLAEWKNVDAEQYEPDDANILNVNFEGLRRSWIGLDRTYTYHNLMCEGVGSFGIQWAYWDDSSTGNERIRWFPIVDLDGNESTTTDSHFIFNDSITGAFYDDRFGVLFNVPDSLGIINESNVWKKIGQVVHTESGTPFARGFYPKALKFTIVLYDSKEIIKGGRTFTKIVYLGN
jgi:prepilin-type N-terminal cleavage/methylation domain-containing protein